jgi:hypothetical protein
MPMGEFQKDLHLGEGLPLIDGPRFWIYKISG